MAQVDIVLLGPSELFFLGRRPGAMNLVLQAADGRQLGRIGTVAAFGQRVLVIRFDVHGFLFWGADGGTSCWVCCWVRC